MSVETLQILTSVFFIVCGVFAVISVILYYVLKIPEVVGNLSGTTARRAIEDIEQKSKNGSGQSVNYSKRLVKGLGGAKKTVKLVRKMNETTILPQNTGNETTLLIQEEQPSFSVDVDLSFYDGTETID